MSETSSLEQPVYNINIIKCLRQGEVASESSAGQSDSAPDQYYLKVNQFYKAVESLKEKSAQKRIRPEVTQYLFYMASQTLIMMLKYLILNDPDSPHTRTHVELFAIAVFSAFIYFYAVETFQMGIGRLIQYQFHLDKVQLSGAVAILVGQYFIGLLGLAEHTLAFRIAYPVWVFYLGSTTRIQVSLYRCNRFQTYSAKALLLVEFALTLASLNLFSGVDQYRGAAFPESARMVSYLFLAAHAFVTANYYKMYSSFDGTNDLRYDFQFQNSLETKIRTQIKQLKKKLLNIESQTDH